MIRRRDIERRGGGEERDGRDKYNKEQEKDIQR